MLNNASLGKCCPEPLYLLPTTAVPRSSAQSSHLSLVHDFGCAFPRPAQVGAPPASASTTYLLHARHGTFLHNHIIAPLLELFRKLFHRLLRKDSGMHVTSSTNGIPVMADGLRGERGWVWGPLTPRNFTKAALCLRNHGSQRPRATSFCW
jgi:hypothetical protein